MFAAQHWFASIHHHTIYFTTYLQKTKFNSTLVVRKFYDTVQLAYERTKAYTEHSSKKFELVKGWSGNGERFKEEIYMRHQIRFSNNIIPEVKRWANKFPSQQKMQSYGQILFVRILLHPKIFLQEKLLLS